LKATMSATEKANLASEKSTIAAEISALSSNQQGIIVQRAANAEGISNAQASVNSAKKYACCCSGRLDIKGSRG